MRTVFEISSQSLDPENSTLLCEVNDEGFSYAVKENQGNNIKALGIYHYDKSKPAVGLPIALNIIFHQKELLTWNFDKIKLVYSTPQSVLIPFSMYHRDKNEEVMNMLYGDLNTNQSILTDVITSPSFYNCYRIPNALNEVVQTSFPGAACLHQHTLLMKQAQGVSDRLNVIFYSNKIVVSLIKDEMVHLINSYKYEVPEDVSFTLLNICSQFNVTGLPLYMSGLIEENSTLYKEVYNFFSEIYMTGFPEGYTFFEEIGGYPSHYFSNIFAIDQCE